LLSDNFTGEAVEFALMVHNYALRRDLLLGGFQIGKPVKDPTAVVTMLNFHANEEIGFVFNAFGRWAPSGRRHGEPHDTQILKLLLDHGEDINALDCIIGYSSAQIFEYCTVLDICIFLLATVRLESPCIIRRFQIVRIS